MSSGVAPALARVMGELERAVVGKHAQMQLLLLAILAGGHVLIEDLPGLAKTLAARSLAQVLGLSFKRIQFTPDLMPSDVTGASVFDQRTSDFAFRPGPLFAQLVLADEVNRAPAKTQAALLEGMQEGQVTVDGIAHPLPEPFIVIATQNPIEYEGTYPLPEAQLDRFLIRARIGYPSPDDEWRMAADRMERRSDDVQLARVMSEAELLAQRASLESVHVSEPIGRYIVHIVNATRQSSRVEVGASPRGTLALLKLARASAAAAGRDYVVPDDVKGIAVPALAHRMTLRAEVWAQRTTQEEVVAAIMETVPAPAADELLLRRPA
jgi:MoxR-like ATPase